MAINLSSLAGKFARTEVAFMGQKARIQYDPMILTAELVNAMTAGSDEAFSEGFCKLVKTWDVKRGNKVVPINQTNLVGIPLPLLQAIFQAIMQDEQEGLEEEGKASPATSPSTAT